MSYGVTMKSRTAIYVKKIWFRLKWLTMSDKEKYVYLLNRTRSTIYAS